MTSPSIPFRSARDERGPYLEVSLRGAELLSDALLNKGTAFTDEERELFGLRGLLPPRVMPIEAQCERVLDNYRHKETDLERYIHLMALLDRNETLFYRVLTTHLESMLPIVYTPTVGQACQNFAHIYRRPRGIYVTPEDLPRLDEVLGHWPQKDVELIVVTDGERILGLGDLGSNGMGISIGKVCLYVAAAGINPSRVLPVCLDVGTNNEKFLADPLYLGSRRRRLSGEPYDAVVDAFVAAAAKRYPAALIQFEDFGKNNAARVLARWRNRVRSFNDDIQGTGAVALAAVLSALRMSGESLETQRVVITGAGSAGVGIAHALAGAGIWMLDSKGLLTADRKGLSDDQRPYMRAEAPADLLETVRRVRPTILIGTSGTPGTFTPEVLSHLSGPRPIVMPLSNPTANHECTPEQALAATGGRAIVATGSPFPGVAQCNNLYVFPGVGLGAIVSGARVVTDRMFRVAAETLADLAPKGKLLPPLDEIRRVARTVATAVAKCALEEGLAKLPSLAAVEAKLDETIWKPEYPRYLPAR